MQLNIEGLTLSNAAGGACEQQFQEVLREMLEIQKHPEDFESGKLGLKFEITAKVKIELDPSDGSVRIEGGTSAKGPKRKARLQLGRVQEEQVLVDAVAAPVQRVIDFTRPNNLKLS